MFQLYIPNIYEHSYTQFGIITYENIQYLPYNITQGG